MARNPRTREFLPLNFDGALNSIQLLSYVTNHIKMMYLLSGKQCKRKTELNLSRLWLFKKKITQNEVISALDVSAS
jgi:hypothetical protein